MILIYHRCGWHSGPYPNWEEVAKALGFPLACRAEDCPGGGASFVGYDEHDPEDVAEAERIAGVSPAP